MNEFPGDLAEFSWPDEEPDRDCRRCGTGLVSQDLMCPRCGWRESPDQWMWSHKPRWLVIVTVVMVLLTVLAMLLPTLQVVVLMIEHLTAGGES